MPIDGDIILKAGLDTEGIKSGIDNLQKTVSRGLKNAIKIGFGVRSVFALIRRLRKSLIGGLGDLAQVHEPLNQAISSIMTSLNLLRNSFASAFAPIIETVAPILVTFINLVAKAVAAVGQFIALLTGKEYVQAAAVQADYASSLDKSASNSNKATSATKKQTEAQKKLNREITHFDDLVILHDKDKDDNDTSTPDVGSGGGGLVNVPIGDAVSQFAKDFLAAWDKADFTDIGRKVGEKLKNALEHIPWEGIKENLAKIGKSIATFLNGFLETPGLFDTIGRTIANAIDAAVVLAESFVWNFHWDSLGIAIRTAIISTLNNINWDRIYHTVSGFAIGLATYLTELFKPETFEAVGSTIARVLNSVLLFLNTFGDTFNFTQFGNSLGRGLRKFFADWDANLTAGIFSKFINGLADALKAALDIFPAGGVGYKVGFTIRTMLKDIEWEERVFPAVSAFGMKLAHFLNGLFTEDTFTEVGNTAAELLNTAFEFLNSFGETFNFEKFGSSLASGINKFLEKFNTTRFTSGINTFITGFHDAIISFLSNISWYDFGLKVRNIIVGINWKQVLVSVGDVVWKAINSAILALKGLFDTNNISSPFTDALDDLSSTIQEAADNIDFDALSEGFNSLVEALRPAAEGFGAGFIAVLDTFLRLGEAFLNALGPALQSIADALNDMDPDLLESIGIALGVIAGAFAVMTVVNTVVTGLQTFVGLLSTMLGPISTFIGTAGTTSAGAAIAGGTGLLGISSGFILLSGAVVGAIAGIALFTEDIESTKGELAPMRSEFSDTRDVIEQVGTQFGLTSGEMDNLAGLLANVSDETKNVDGVYNLFDQHLRDAGVDVDAFKTSLSQAASVAASSGQDIDGLQGYIEGVGTKASEADTSTSDFAGAFDLFKDLSITTPLKMLLISNAIKNLGEKGALSDEDVTNLYSTLDNYNADPTEKNMAKVEKAFENAGVSADDFMVALTESVATMDPAVSKEVGKAVKTIKDSGPNLKSESKDSFKNVGTGAEEGIDESSPKVVNAAGDMIDDSFDEMDKRAESHSPSRRANTLGTNIGEGLRIGLNGKQNILVQLAGTIIDAMLDKIETFYNSFTTTGQTLANNLYDGFNKGANKLTTLASSIGTSMYNKFSSLSFYEVGDNIATGIYMGLFDNKQWLKTLAWNTAVEMYNSACAALGISSPSKKFAWVGEMITKGLGKGIIDNEDNAVDAVTDIANAMTEEAETANPSVTISTSIEGWIDALDNVLTKFSQTIIDRFDGMVNALVALSSMPTMIPAVAQGKVIPSSLQSASGSNDTALNMMRMLENLTASQITTDDLRPLLIEMFNDYMNLSWYIGDEQLALHTNAGNAILDRRYNVIK